MTNNILFFFFLLLLGCGGAVEGDFYSSTSNDVGGEGGQPQAIKDVAGAAGVGETSSAGSDQGVCVRKTFEEACPAVGSQEKSCGGVRDGCGGAIDCGGCSWVHACDNTQNVCMTCVATGDEIMQNYCKENEPDRPTAYRDCNFEFHDCVRVDSAHWCCSF